MYRDIRNAIGLITSQKYPNAVARGGGTLVASNLVLTALHVIADREVDPPAFNDRIHVKFGNGSSDAVPVAYDRALDVALLELETEQSLLIPIPLAELDDGATPSFTSFGYPDLNPDGITISGRIAIVEGSERGVGTPLMQLDCDLANGLEIQGMSGSPCLVNDAVAGVITRSLQKRLNGKHMVNVGGVLYATLTRSIRQIESISRLLPPTRATARMPPLPRQDLPSRPFRYLSPYTQKHAEIFFGRDDEILVLFRFMTVADRAPICLLHGASGVGKSSLLAAGLLPHLHPTHDVEYRRRDGKFSLTETMASILGIDRGSDVELFRTVWLAREAIAGQRHQRNARPLVIVLDQAEEAFIRGDRAGKDELQELVRVLHAVFADPSNRPQGKVILSFRKEWLAEVQCEFDSSELPHELVPISALDRTGLMEAIMGPCASPRLRDHFKLVIDPDVPRLLVEKVLEDGLSPAAPMLQILLSRMWERACVEGQRGPHFTVDLYKRLRSNIFDLRIFLDDQIETLPLECAQHVTSGLVDDILELHITSRSTAREVTTAALFDRYGHRSREASSLVEALKNNFVLAGPTATEGSVKTTHLVHDTLCPEVRDRFATSDRPGQRARRILEARAEEWKEGAAGRPLDESDLAVVHAGLVGMRDTTPSEKRLIDESEIQARNRNRRLWATRGLTAAAVSVIIGAIIYARTQGAKALDAAHGAVQAQQLERAEHALALAKQPGDEHVALMTSLVAVSESAGDDPPARWKAVEALSAALVANHRSSPVEHGLGADVKLILSPDGKRLASEHTGNLATRKSAKSDDPGGTLLWDFKTGHQIARLEGGCAWFSPETDSIATSTKQATTFWDTKDGRFISSFAHGQRSNEHVSDISCPVFAGGGHQLLLRGLGVTSLRGVPDGEVITVFDDDLLEFDATGKWIIGGKRDGSRIAIRSAATGHVERLMDQRPGVLSSLRIAPEGRFILGSYGNELAVWDGLSGRIKYVLNVPEILRGSYRFLDDGARILTYDGRRARAWRTSTGHLSWSSELSDASSTEPGIAIVSDSGTRMFLKSRREARVIDLSSGSALLLDSAARGLGRAWFSSNGDFLATTTGNVVHVWDVAQGNLVDELAAHTREITGTAFVDAGAVVTAGQDGFIRFWHAPQSAVLATMNVANNTSPSHPWPSSDGKKMLASWERCRVGGLDLASLSTLTVSHPSGCDQVLATSHDTSSWVVWQAADERYSIVSVANGATVNVLSEPAWLNTEGGATPAGAALGPRDGCDPSPRDFVLSDDDTTLVGRCKEMFQVWDMHTGAPRGSFSLSTNDSTGRLRLSPDGTTLLVEEVGKFELVSVPHGRSLATFQNSEELGARHARGMTLGAGGDLALLLAGGAPNRSTYYRGRDHVQIDLTTRRVYWFPQDAVFTDGGWLVISASVIDDVNNGVRIATMNRGEVEDKQVGIICHNLQSVHAVALSARSRRAACAGSNQKLIIWDLESGSPISDIDTAGEEVSSVTFSPDGDRILTSGDRSVRLWNVRDHRLFAQFPSAGPVERALFLPDGKRIVTTSKDGTLRLFPATVEGLVEEGCKRVDWSTEPTVAPSSCRTPVAPM